MSSSAAITSTTFGIGAFAGRTIQPSDDQRIRGSRRHAQLSRMAAAIWLRSQQSSAPCFILNGHPFTIIGITPPGFFGETLRSDPPDLWLPINAGTDLQRSKLLPASLSGMAARHRPAQARRNSPTPYPTRMTALIRQWLVNDSGMPADWMSGIKAGLPKQIVKVVPAGNGVGLMKEDYGANLRILLAVCCLVLLIACANIANLLLARGASRRAQTSVRLALGASRKRLIRQSLTESLVLSVFGGLAGLIIAYLGVKLLVALTFHSAKFVPIDATPSLPVLAFAFALSLLTGVLFGTAPAWLASHADPAEALRGANRSTQ